MQAISWLPDNVELIPHSQARDKSVAKQIFKAGACILSTSAFASILLDSEKGRRCDNCFRFPALDKTLKRCTGCGSYWYCDAQCQDIQWRIHHKRICKTINFYMSSPEYQALPEHQKHDSLLLSHTVAQMSLLPNPYSFDDSSTAAILLTLLPHPCDFVEPPVICSIKPSAPPLLLGRIYARFGNNNFAIHSHLTTIGHGVFPIASRLFNHSCLPNAAAKYSLSPTQSIVMDVVALRDILPGEEICLPYLDPALLQAREQILELSYGFKCGCPSCLFLPRIGPLPEPPTNPAELSRLGSQLREFIGIDSIMNLKIPQVSIEATPPALYQVLRESYLGNLSETFSRASHEGQYDVAHESGLTLLSLYLLLYPVNYPQIGIHLLELAKTTWNSLISLAAVSNAQSQIIKGQVKVFLTLASETLIVFGEEGDDGGPLQEIAVLENLLSVE
ncbi:hypothetical protein GALMADRAFT_1348489 [Galerina marginata CBS 339.88]|uniref:MYND-type domain-containing protein n=1 Tax=Galerina marginata (strain CBS 339.88) TaxID=685588 RepID=A0A067TUZ7_GALM3|nr:hypothetical protein GALMADRAFT_1348489 [Galerina marginata CBS 339.88]